MRVRVVYMGVLKEITGRRDEIRDLPEGGTTEQLFSTIRGEMPAIERYARSLAIAVNHKFAASETVLRDGDEVALLPPVSGGSVSEGSGTETARRTRIISERIDAEVLVAAMKDPADGAVVVFDGIVRNQSRGRRTLYLDYEAYEPMASQELESLATQAREKFPVREVAIVHRVGRINIGESSVLIVVSSAHRAAAFDACRWIIDTLKKTVPIWKKEYFEDGAVWADGDPFPPEVTTG